MDPLGLKPWFFRSPWHLFVQTLTADVVPNPWNRPILGHGSTSLQGGAPGRKRSVGEHNSNNYIWFMVVLTIVSD